MGQSKVRDESLRNKSFHDNLLRNSKLIITFCLPNEYMMKNYVDMKKSKGHLKTIRLTFVISTSSCAIDSNDDPLIRATYSPSSSIETFRIST